MLDEDPPALDPKTQAWVDEKHKQGQQGLATPEDYEAQRRAVEAAKARAKAQAPSDDLFSLPPQPVEAKPPVAPPPPDTADPLEEPVPTPGPPSPPAKGMDAVLADSFEPQLGLDLGDEVVKSDTPKLTDKFVVPMFSVLDTRADYWQKRRGQPQPPRGWLGLGIRSEVGREGGLIYDPETHGSDPMFFAKKREMVAKLGRDLTSKEFRELSGANSVGGNPARARVIHKKRAELGKALGREVPVEEYLRDHWRGDDVELGSSGSIISGTSVFDPVLCEIIYRWFSDKGSVVLDPFAGGSVRGIVAGALGRPYVGVELRAEQIADNRQQAEAILGEDAPCDFGRATPLPQWVEGDATSLPALRLPEADLVFTCPPYADLEVYSDDPRDLSTMPYERFRGALAAAVRQSTEQLKPNRFAVWVVGEARDKKVGNSYGLVADTVKAGQAAGMALYNEAILLNSGASAAFRAAKTFKYRKLTRIHQHVLVFVKGDPRLAAKACGEASLDA